MNIMLKDRRALLEYEIEKANARAASMYLSMVTCGNDLGNQDYQTLTEQVSNLTHDLALVNQLISQGHV